MPVIIAGLLRAAIQFAVTLGIISLIERTVLPLLNNAIAKVMIAFGVDEARAKDIVANSWITAFEEIGIAAATIRTKTPAKIAELLGFTSKGFSKRILPKALVDKFPSLAGIAGAEATATATSIAKVAESVAKSRKLSLDTVSKFAQLLIAGLGVPIGAGLLVINTIDFAAWPTSRYQGTFQKFFAIFGLEADKDKTSTKVLSDDQFNKAFEVFRLEGAQAISNPYTGQTVPFTRDNLVVLLDKIAAAILVENGKYTINQVIAASIGYMLTGTKAPTTTTAPAPAPIRPVVQTQPITRTKTVLTASPDELTNLALGKIANLLDGIPAKLDFELTSKNNPIDNNGTLLPGTFYVLRVDLRTGQFGKTKLAEIVLRPLAEGEKKLTAIQEEPFEAALRFAMGSATRGGTVADNGNGIGTIPIEPLAVLEPKEPGTFVPYNSIFRINGWLVEIINNASMFGGRSTAIIQSETIIKERQLDPREISVIDPSKLVITKDDTPETIRLLGKAVYKIALLGDTADIIIPEDTTYQALKSVAPIAPINVIKPYIQFSGSPDVFERLSGRRIDNTEAQQKNIFGLGLIQQIPRPRPEVKVASDFALWSQRNLTSFDF